MPTIVRKSDQPYRWSDGQVSLAEVANKEKMMPRNFITEDGFGITPACRRYLSPLIKGGDYPPNTNGLPAYVSLKNQRVARKLTTEFVLM
jgi:6-phosphofructokinase 1